MISIERCSEYNVRVMKDPDFKNKICGYNFSYPVMNTIDICNLFILGGSVDIAMNGKAKSTWSFDIDNSTLSIKGRNIEEKYVIVDVSELGEAMIGYFNKNKEDILQKTLNANIKRSKSNQGNKNAQKSKDINCNDTNPPPDFCTLNDFDGSPEEYFALIDEKGYNCYLTAEDIEYKYEHQFW